MKIKEPSLSDLISEVNSGQIMLPGFQRDYVWDTGKVSELLTSLFKSRPIGMATSWLQPQNHPHTLPVRFSLKDDEQILFGDFKATPAVTSLVLDGRQRITTILHVFTNSFYPKNSKYSHANRWFLNLEKKLGEDGSVKSVKINKLKLTKMDSVAGCISQGFYPLDAWSDIAINSPTIFADGTYAKKEKPDKATLDRRAATLQNAYRILMGFKFPIAEIGENFGLSDVCEIFEILNTTGTRVSVFDLIHTFLFQYNYDLRSTHSELKKDSPGIHIFGDADPVYYSQLVTATWIAQDPNLEPAGRDGQKIEGIKAGSLLNTTEEAYRHFEKIATSEKLKDALAELYVCFGGKFILQDSAYPVSLTLFIATNLNAETLEYKKRLRALFRAFYYRNSLLKRYTEGYLTKYAEDLKFLHDTIRLKNTEDFSIWVPEAAQLLEKHMQGEPGDPPAVPVEIIEAQLLSTELTPGAQHQLYTMYLLCRHNLDLLTAEELDVAIKNPEEKSVEIHHIYPKQWLAKNKAGREAQLAMVDCFANKVPLTRVSNGFWKDKAPNTVLSEKKKTWANSASQFEKCRIDSEGFTLLGEQPSAENIGKLWALRAKKMAVEIFNVQKVDFNGFDRS